MSKKCGDDILKEFTFLKNSNPLYFVLEFSRQVFAQRKKILDFLWSKNAWQNTFQKCKKWLFLVPLNLDGFIAYSSYQAKFRMQHWPIKNTSSQNILMEAAGRCPTDAENEINILEVQQRWLCSSFSGKERHPCEENISFIWPLFFYCSAHEKRQVLDL